MLFQAGIHQEQSSNHMLINIFQQFALIPTSSNRQKYTDSSMHIKLHIQFYNYLEHLCFLLSKKDNWFLMQLITYLYLYQGICKLLCQADVSKLIDVKMTLESPICIYYAFEWGHYMQLSRTSMLHSCTSYCQ